jgi:multidrug efflux pump subunit AcrB
MSGQTPSSVAKIRLTDIFIERPVLALVVSLLILLLGVQAIATLSIVNFR